MSPHLEQVAAWLRERGIRVEIDASSDRMQKKIRNAQKQKVPFMLLAGDDDVAKGAVSFRYRSGEQNNGVPVDDAIEEIVKAVERARPGLSRRRLRAAPETARSPAAALASGWSRCVTGSVREWRQPSVRRWSSSVGLRRGPSSEARRSAPAAARRRRSR